MKLEKASIKAIRYACKKFHYAKSIPVATHGYSVFNDANEWCGVVLYGRGANNNLAKAYGLAQGQVIELVRVALNGKQETTSKAVSISIKLIKKDVPLAKLLISYADSEQGHIGTIYQATNWYYTGESFAEEAEIDGKRYHKRIVYSTYGTNSVKKLKEKGVNIKAVRTKAKFRYIFPLVNEMKPICQKLKKDYPKRGVSSLEAGNGESAELTSSEAGGSIPTTPL